MASLSPEEKVEFLLNVLATSDEFKPNYGALAVKMGINTNQNAQRRLKGIVEAGKTYVLQCDKNSTRVIDAQESGNGEQASVPTPKSKRRTKKAEARLDDEGTPSKKGRKAPKEDDEGGDVVGEDEI